MSQKINDFEECKKVVYNIIRECEAYGAWCGHEYAVEYLQKEYNYIIKFATKYDLDVSNLIKSYKASETYIDTVFKKALPTYQQTQELNKLDSDFVECIYDTAHYLMTYYIEEKE
jgi:hypothetical protein